MPPGSPKNGVLNALTNSERNCNLTALRDVEVLEHREIEVPLARALEDVVPGAAVVAEVRTAWDIAGDPLECLRIEPLGPRAGCPVLASPIRSGRTAPPGIQVAALRHRRKGSRYGAR